MYLVNLQNSPVLFRINNKGRLMMHMVGEGKEHDCENLLDFSTLPHETKEAIEKAKRVLSK